MNWIGKSGTFAAATLLLTMIVGGCHREGAAFVLTAHDLPEVYNGTSAFILTNDKSEVVARIPIEDGSLEYTASPNSHSLYRLALGDEQHIVIDELVMEGSGELYAFEVEPTLMEPDKTTDFAIRWSEDAELNLALQFFRSDLEEKVEPLSEELNQLGYELLRRREEPQEVLDSLNVRYDELAQEANEAHAVVTREYARLHADDAVGIAVFREIGYTDEADFVRKYEEASETIRRDPLLKGLYDQYVVIIETSAGRMYKDFTMDDGEGTQVKLSDYMALGQYLLVDFWASWCGPCRKGIPFIAKLYKEYGDRGLRVLSIGVSETDKATNERAAEEVGIVWDHFYDASSESADTYGVVTIPVVLLISPDGEILLRDSHADAAGEILRRKLGDREVTPQ